MELLAIVGILITLVVIYFFTGVLITFLWGWWILLVAAPLALVVGIYFGWLGAIVGIGGFIASIQANNAWHDSKPYLAVLARLNKAFYFSDT